MDLSLLSDRSMLGLSCYLYALQEGPETLSELEARLTRAVSVAGRMPLPGASTSMLARALEKVSMARRKSDKCLALAETYSERGRDLMHMHADGQRRKLHLWDARRAKAQSQGWWEGTAEGLLAAQDVAAFFYVAKLPHTVAEP